MRKYLSVFLIWTCLSVYSQNTFADIKEEVDTWFQTVNTVFTTNTKAPKSIDFTTQKYSINGIISKGILCDGTTAKFYDTTSLVPALLLEGRVSYYAGRLVIEGIRYFKTSNGTNKIYGSFYVYNMDDFTMNYKRKKAGALRIKNSIVSYLEGFYRDRPAIVSMINGNTVYLDRKKEGNSFTFLSAELPNITLNEDDSFDIYQILLQAKENVTMCWENGIQFKGRIKPTPKEDGSIIFLPLDGQRTGMTDGRKSITVSHENGNIVYSIEFGEDNKLLSNESWLVKDNGTISENDYWNAEKMLEHCYLTKWEYRDGAYFEGTLKYDIKRNEDSIPYSISTIATKGVFKYPNGDRFEGDLSSKSVGPFFVDGTTFFADGSKVTGNWLGKYQLNNSQWERVYKCKNPSEAKNLAQRLTRSINYPEYEYSGSIEYFDPKDERQSSTYAHYLIYNKSKKRYTCKYKDSTETILEFAVDNKGYRKWEIVFEDGNPTYINEFTWYSNGVIESIKSFAYDTKKIYLTCYFFSDGKLRSAYQYGQGNSGTIVLRKSKESNPTYGGYTCKLYDLNGNYERSTDWNIGVGESLFGGRYNMKMAPTHLIFKNLKPIDDF